MLIPQFDGWREGVYDTFHLWVVRIRPLKVDGKGDIMEVQNLIVPFEDRSLDGVIEIGKSAPRVSVLPIFPTGASITISMPRGFGDQLTTYTYLVVFELNQRGYGFQVVPRGSGALALPHDADIFASQPVSFGDGVLVYYGDRSQPGHNGLSLWQGPFHDVITFDHNSLETAIVGVDRVEFFDRAAGVLIAPKNHLTRVRRQSATVEWGPLLLDIQPLTMRPAVLGLEGNNGEFYWRNESDLMFVSESALVDIRRWGPASDEYDARLVDPDVAALVTEMSVTWTEGRSMGVDAGLRVRYRIVRAW